jgi:hypothetical protein
VICKAHTRRSEASTASASCACRMHQLHRYLKGHHRRSMLLRPRARRCCLANCRSRSGWRSSLSAREKRARAGGKSVLCSQGSICYPATRAKFPSRTILPRRQLRTNGLPHHRTMWSRCLMGGPPGRWAEKYTWSIIPLLFFLIISHSLNCDRYIFFVVSSFSTSPGILRTRSSIQSNEQDCPRRIAPYSLVLPETRQDGFHHQQSQVVPKDQRDQDILGPRCGIWRRLPQCQGRPLVDRLQDRNTHVTLPSVSEIAN